MSSSSQQDPVESSMHQDDGIRSSTASPSSFGWATSWIHPGHFLFATSLPFCISAYRGYQVPLERLVQDVLQQQTAGRVKIENLKTAEEGIRRAVGSAVASRALRVATTGSVGIFGLTSALIFYASGCTTVNQAVCSTRDWAHSGRKRVDTLFGIDNRVDKDHPEVLLTRDMTEEQELEYVSKRYLPDEDWGTDPADDNKKEDSGQRK